MKWIVLTSDFTETTQAAAVPGGVLVKVTDSFLSTLDVTFIPNCHIIAGGCGEKGKLYADQIPQLPTIL